MRTSRTVALTEAGKQLATHAPSALAALERAIGAAQHAASGGWEV